MVFVTLSDKAALFLDKQDAHLKVTKFRENKEDGQRAINEKKTSEEECRSWAVIFNKYVRAVWEIRRFKAKSDKIKKTGTLISNATK